MEVGWIVVGTASLPLSESYDFRAGLLEQTGGLWTWAIPLRDIPRSAATLLVAGLVLVTLAYFVAWLQYRGRGRLSQRWTSASRWSSSSRCC